MTIQVSSIPEVLERLRLDVIAQLRSLPAAIPPAANEVGGCADALTALFRLQHRSVSRRPRTVRCSAELQQRVASGEYQLEVAAIEREVMQGEDLTHRQTRQFYKAGFNDFLFNNFGIHHLHLGLRGAGVDRTGQHAMSGGMADVLFVLITRTAVHFIDVRGHGVFESAEETKSLLQIVIRNWPDLLPSVAGIMELSFEDAFRLAKLGFTTGFELDGVSLLTGGNVTDGEVRHGRRAPCTSIAVVEASNSILNRVCSLVRQVTDEADVIADRIKVLTGARPARLELEVLQVGRSVAAKEIQSGALLHFDGAAITVVLGA